MKVFKLIGVGLLSLIVSFFAFFTVLEVYKHTDGSELFRAQNPYDLVIQNARIIDGTGGEIIQGDIGIRNNKIIKVGSRLKTDKAKIFDAAGYTVAPGKIEWPLEPDWVRRDLATALVRYPPHRIIIAQSQDPNWRGKSVQALLSDENITKNNLAGDSTAIAFITPPLDIPQNHDLMLAYYQLSGWRGELLGENVGKIKEGYEARLVVFNHREVNGEELLRYLNEEKLPPIQYIIEGSHIQSTKTDS